MCLFAADKTGAFDGFWLSKIVGIGATLGSLAAIAVAGLLLGSMLSTTEMTALRGRTQFTLWFVAGCAAAALLLTRSYGISKNSATPSWCLWACAISATLWYGFYLISDVHPVRAISRPLELAGQNVLLALFAFRNATRFAAGPSPRRLVWKSCREPSISHRTLDDLRVADPVGFHRTQSGRLPAQALTSASSDSSRLHSWCADSTDVTPQPIAKQEFVSGEIRGVITVVEDERLSIDARDEAFPGR
jgi:hypothetical protein